MSKDRSCDPFFYRKDSMMKLTITVLCLMMFVACGCKGTARQPGVNIRVDYVFRFDEEGRQAIAVSLLNR